MDLGDDSDAARQSLLGGAEDVDINNDSGRGSGQGTQLDSTTVDSSEDINLAEVGESGEIGGRRRHARRSKNNRTRHTWEGIKSTVESLRGSISAEREVHLPLMTIPDDSFSMLYLAEDWLQAMFPLSVFCTQMTIIILMNVNFSHQGSPRTNPLKVPVNVDTSVKVSQGIACLVSVVAAEDFSQGIIYAGRSWTHRKSLPEDDAKSSISIKWEVINLMRVLEGVGVLGTSFIFIIQSNTVIDLWLNFAGMAFVGLLDNTAFFLAKNDFLGPRQRSLAERVSRVEFHPIKVATSFGRKVNSSRKFSFVFVAVGMLAGWGVFLMRQQKQEYACRSVKLTVSDSEHRQLRHFSGSYTRTDESPLHGRAVYTQNQGKGLTTLAYCNADMRWTVLRKQDSVKGDPCKDFELMSEITKTYDIREVTHLVFRDYVDEAHHGVECIDCSIEVGCSRHGHCDENTRSCRCNAGYFGYSCQFKGPCTEVRLPEENPMKKYGFFYPLGLLYHERENVMIYDRPVYVDELSNSYHFGIIAYDGGRWVFMSRLKGAKKEKESFAKYLADEFDGKFSDKYALEAVSEPTNSGSPEGIPFRAVVAKAQNTIGRLTDEEFFLDCADCNNGTSEIEYCSDRRGYPRPEMCKTEEHETHGTINRCKCDPGFMGPLCKIPPIEGGASLYLDLGEEMCTSCGSSWWFFGLKHTNGGCARVPTPVASIKGKNREPFPLYFEGNRQRRFLVSLNVSHFSILVQSPIGYNNSLCNDGGNHTKEVVSIRRGGGGNNERIHIDFAVHLNQANDFFGQVVDAEQVECNVMMLSGQPGCRVPIRNAYENISGFDQAWLHLDLKITP